MHTLCVPCMPRACQASTLYPACAPLAAHSPTLLLRRRGARLACARVLLLHGERDDTVPPSSSALFALALARAGHAVELVPLPRDTHGSFLLDLSLGRECALLPHVIQEQSLDISPRLFPLQQQCSRVRRRFQPSPFSVLGLHDINTPFKLTITSIRAGRVTFCRAVRVRPVRAVRVAVRQAREDCAAWKAERASAEAGGCRCD